MVKGLYMDVMGRLNGVETKKKPKKKQTKANQSSPVVAGGMTALGDFPKWQRASERASERQTYDRRWKEGRKQRRKEGMNEGGRKNKRKERTFCCVFQERKQAPPKRFFLLEGGDQAPVPGWIDGQNGLRIGRRAPGPPAHRRLHLAVSGLAGHRWARKTNGAWLLGTQSPGLGRAKSGGDVFPPTSLLILDDGVPASIPSHRMWSMR
jgi:hypothetical protein